MKLTHSIFLASLWRLSVCLVLLATTVNTKAENLSSCQLFSDYECSIDTSWKMLTRWADAWSNADVHTYLASYTTKGSPDQSKNRKVWLASRQRALTKAVDVKIKLNFIDLQILPNRRARATVIQHYDAVHFSDIVLKTMYLVVENNEAKIQREMVERTLSKKQAQELIDAFG